MPAKKDKPTQTYPVKFGSVVLTVKPWRHPSGKDYWRASYYLEDGKERHITRAELADAKAAALEKAQEIAKGTIDLNSLTPHQIRAIKRMLEADPQLSTVDEFLAWHTRKYPRTLLADAVEEYLKQVESNKGLSSQHYRTQVDLLRPMVKAFPERVLADITPTEIADYLNKPNWALRTRKNVRSALVSLCRWAVAHEMLPEGKSAPERVMMPRIKRKTPATYSPQEMALLLKHVSPDYLPWLAAAAFGGFRTDEIYPGKGSTKPPLDWADFHWDRDIIIVRAETSKTDRRVVPILPALREWLYPIKKESGPVCATKYAPSAKQTMQSDSAETRRLGALVGGWRANALRHSWISYRAAVVGIGQAALEAGNSESESRASYNDAKSRAEAELWFSITPGTVQNICEKYSQVI